MTPETKFNLGIATVGLAQASLGTGLRTLKKKRTEVRGAQKTLGSPRLQWDITLTPAHESQGLCLLLCKPGGRSVSPRPCVVPVVMGLLAFCNGQGVGRQCTHASCGDWALPVFSGTGLAAADVETGAAAARAAPGWAL